MSDSKPWTEIEIHDWAEFDQQMNGLKQREWLYRGQSDINWDLSTPIERLFVDLRPIIRSAKGVLRKFAKKEQERLLVRTFQKSANLYLSSLPERAKTLEWLAIMQHYGTPTRLLDTTLSPHIALYFAMESGSGDSCIFAFDHVKLKEQNRIKLQNKTYKQIYNSYFVHAPRPNDDDSDQLYNANLQNDEFITFFTPEQSNERLLVQQGSFLVPSTLDRSLEELLETYKQDLIANVCIKFIIPAKLRYEGIERLRRMNITSATLFPGIDGFCKSLKFQVLETTGNQRLFE